MSAKHTPGPWKARWTPSRVPNVPDLWCIDWSEDNEEVAEIVHGEADARLIASAPDLLEALEGMFASMKTSDIDAMAAAMEKGIYAMAKAKGEKV